MKVLAIAAMTLREAIRRKVQVNLLLFGAVLLGASAVASALTIGEGRRIIVDLGLSAMGLIGTLLAVLLGASLIAGDVERRAVYPVVAKPVSRAEYLLGRYAGLAATLVLNIAAMALLLVLLVVADAGSRAVDWALGAAIAMLVLKVLVVAAVAVFFSSFTTTTLAAIFALTVAIAGHMTNDMKALWRGDGSWVPRAVWYALPNLGSLTLNDAAIYHVVPTASSWVAAGCALLYAATVLALSAAIFERRDFR